MIDMTKKAELLMGLIFLACLSLILAALGFQHLGGIMPCDLCYKQRWVYYLAIATVPIALFFYGREMPRASRVILLIMVAAFFANAILGIYHAGVEWKFWAGPSACTGGGDLDATIDLLDALKNVKIVPCDKVQWTFLGISMAGYSALSSLGLGLVSLFTAIKACK